MQYNTVQVQWRSGTRSTIQFRYSGDQVQGIYKIMRTHFSQPTAKIVIIHNFIID